MPDMPLNLTEIEQRIAAIWENLLELEEQAAAYSGAADEGETGAIVCVKHFHFHGRLIVWFRD